MTQRLSAHFTLDEFVASRTARAHEIALKPSYEQIENMRALCGEVLEPLRDLLGCPLQILSGFRTAELNRLVGGAKDSHHLCLGPYAAADIRPIGVTAMEAFKRLVVTGIPYDQAIFADTYLHLSHARNRRQDLRKQGGRYTAFPVV